MKYPWYKNTIMYGLSVRQFQDSDGDGIGDLKGLCQRLDYLVELGVEALWVMPIYPTPYRDSGYDIKDYLSIDPCIGTLEDFIHFVEEAHKRNLRVVVDLVMNHTSDQHPWFQASRYDPDSIYHSYYVWSDDPPAVPATHGPIFPGPEDSVWTYDDVARSYYFHRFYHFQPGLQVANPEVQEEIRKVMEFWLSFRIDGFRMDAAPIMIQKKGLDKTKPEDPHQILKTLHDTTTRLNPDAVLLGEANVALDKLPPFFSDGKEMTMLFNFYLSAYLFLAFAKQSWEELVNLLENKLPNPPQNCQWGNFLRNQDELSVEFLNDKQQEVIFSTFAPEETMRIYGRGIRRRLAPLLDGNRERIELAFSLMFSIPGSPVILYGDEIGMGDNLDLHGRDALHTPMQWSDDENGGFSTADADHLISPVISTGPFDYHQVNVAREQADPHSLLNWLKSLISVRKQCPEIGMAIFNHRPAGNSALLVHEFIHPDYEGSFQEGRRLIFFHNLSDRAQSVQIDLKADEVATLTKLLGNGSDQVVNEERFEVQLPAYGYGWYRVRS